MQIFEVILFFKLRTTKQQKTIKPTYLLSVWCQEAGGRSSSLSSAYQPSALLLRHTGSRSFWENLLSFISSLPRAHRYMNSNTLWYSETRTFVGLGRSAVWVGPEIYYSRSRVVSVAKRQKKKKKYSYLGGIVRSWISVVAFSPLARILG